jgi:hypothetical protein
MALILQKLYDGWKAKKNMNKTKENLIYELKGIASSFSENELADIIHFDTPIWRSVGATGSILDILRENKKFYDDLYEIYGKLFGLKKLEENFTRNEGKIVELRKEIKEIIVEGQKQWLQKQWSQSPMGKTPIARLKLLKNCKK